MPKPKQKTLQKTRSRPSKAKSAATAEFDGVYLFKIVAYLLLGSIWIKISSDDGMTIPIPIGLIIGLLLVMHERLQIDRKIEYAVMVVAMLFGYFAPYGLYVAF